VPLHLYFANEDNSKLKLEVRYISVEEAKKSTSQLAGIIVNELIKGPTSTKGYKPTIPEGSKLRSAITIKDGVAVVDMSKEFKQANSVGKDEERMTIYSIVNSLTELKEIQKVKFTIAGKTQKEYMGHFQFDQAFPRSAGLISKDTAAPGTAAKTKKKEEQKQEDTNTKAAPTTDSKTKAAPTTDSKTKAAPTTDTKTPAPAKTESSSGGTEGDTQETSGSAGDEFELLE
jgi:hypothetical protein